MSRLYNKTTDNKNSAFANNPAKQKSSLQGAYHEMANNSEQVQQLKAYQSFADAASLKAMRSTGKPGAPSTGPVVQRAPADWQGNADITRIVNRGHGLFSTYSDIKEKINAYLQLQPGQRAQRTSLLNEIKTLMAKWEAKYPPDSTEQRVIDIRADLLILGGLIDAELTEIEDTYITDFSSGIRPPGGIPPELTDGLWWRSAADKAAEIFHRINNFRFRYTGVGTIPQLAFSAHQGDCGSLVGMYMQVADAAGVPNQQQSFPDRLLVAPQPIHGRTETRNTDPAGEAAWYFQNHHWVTANGVNYDVLFMTSPPPAFVATNGSAIYNGVQYYTFGDGRVAIERQPNVLNHAVQGNGLVFINAEAAHVFIDAHYV